MERLELQLFVSSRWKSPTKTIAETLRRLADDFERDGMLSDAKPSKFGEQAPLRTKRGAICGNARITITGKGD